ncbi:MAG TPA: ABC transporter ATP-binding protein [Burkholderiales bacterium]|jgi:ABC-2 type transport system ATP-binding protein|nr:ABC transporter ATP-binding protein [Burkholderiales bacterium]
MSSPAAITLESVSKRYGSKLIIDDVSFAVEKGEIVGFLGPNGAGKTTTMRMIAGFTTPTSGRITVAGYDMATQNTEAARHIGYLPERPPLYDTLDVAQYLRFVAKVKGIPRSQIASELERVSAACHLEAVFRREIYKLSKGYRQRLGLAQALLGKPTVLLLDEPTAGLDPGQIQETREVIRSFGETNAVLLSTHILHEVTLICRRVAILNHGRLLAIDSPAGLQRASEQTNRVVLQVTAPAAQLREELLGVNGVRSIEIDSGRDNGVLSVACQVDAHDGVEAAIARAVAVRWNLHRLERQQPTLENVFLRYVSGPATEKEPQA